VTFVLWDASALAKALVMERGSESVDAVFRALPLRQMAVTYLVYAETVAVLIRKRNHGALDPRAFEAATAALHNDIIFAPDLQLLDSSTGIILQSVEQIVRHNINASDGVMLETYLGYAQSVLPAGDRAILVTADARLERAAQAEGLATINPERMSPAEVEAGLAS